MAKVNPVVHAPDVTIIIPTFNRAGSLTRSLNSIALQSHQLWECIVIDDGSTDATSQLMSDFTSRDPRFRFFKRPSSRKKGANSCRNIGIVEAQAKFVTFLDSDDTYLPDHIGTRLRQLVELKADASFGSGYIFDGRIRTRLNTIEKDVNTTWFDFILQRTVPICSLFLKKEIAESTLFDEDLLRHQDWDFLLRLPQGVRFAYCDTPTYVINWVRNEKRAIHFPSCIEVYKRHQSLLSPNIFLKQYLLGMYEKAVHYEADRGIVEFYRREVKRLFQSFTTTEALKLRFPSFYKIVRSLVNIVR